MDRNEILELLLKDHSHDDLILSPELYSIEHDMEEWMLENRAYWMKKLPQLRRSNCRIQKELEEEDPAMKKYAGNYWRIRKIVSFYERERRLWRICCNANIARFWQRLLTVRPEFANRCPWRCFQGDSIWQSLQDEAFCLALKLTPEELAQKFNLHTLSQPDWDEVLKVAPGLAPLLTPQKTEVI